MYNFNRLKVAGFIITLGLIGYFYAAKGGVKNTTYYNAATNSPSNILIALAIDRSPSFSGYRRIDTGFIGHVCRKVAKTGGIVIAYRIGNPTDKSGLRLKLKRIPQMDPSLVLSKQLLLRREIDRLKAFNETAIRNYLMDVQEQILGPPVEKVKGTDINGLFKKLEVLMSEPEYADFDRIALVYSDGIQSLNGKSSPARYDYKAHNLFKMYLCGWKTGMPTSSVAIRQFEDVEGFSEYLDSMNSLNN